MSKNQYLARLAVFALLACGCARHLHAAEPEIDTSPLEIGVELAFPEIEWAGWQAESDDGQIVPLRPILLTHAGDDSNRVFVPTQQGVIYVFPNDQQVKKADVFLDMTEKVSYSDKTNEEGFLGLAFHPKFAKDGRLFVYYTNKAQPHQNVIASYRVKSDNPAQVDPDSEEILLVLDKPFWNHDGGTLAFGPDGYLYIAVGDGGAANDPFGNGQKLSTRLGKILRIDVDQRTGDLPYSIPADNPFVDQAKAKPEIWAYGLRNVWRMAFDRKTGTLWAGDVGQDLWEEIDLIVRGGNYGWNLREGFHPFGPKGADARADLIEPIWEYHHDVGKSITGGHVYRGKAIPELEGAYLYADYVSGKLWALTYDAEAKRVTANREIPLPRSIPIMSFGEDEQGESYFTTFAPDGKGVFRLVPQKDEN
jgi:glucose/arabinose dehydrogenase